MKLETSNFPNGLYLVQINSQNKFYTQKFIKQ
ncbi:MAG: T9SS type A sorting domain-containing protein [Bacteroidetes bacterium]|nr:T9SS type A sorting domain-containing protein [Bacteroidota bacterium]